MVAAALGAADHALPVASSDPLSVHRAQLARKEAAGLLEEEKSSLVVNRCDNRQDAASCTAAL